MERSRCRSNTNVSGGAPHHATAHAPRTYYWLARLPRLHHEPACGSTTWSSVEGETEQWSFGTGVAQFAQSAVWVQVAPSTPARDSWEYQRQDTTQASTSDWQGAWDDGRIRVKPLRQSFHMKQMIAHHPLRAFIVMALLFSWIAVPPLILNPALPVEPFQMLGAFAGPTLAAIIVIAVTEAEPGWPHSSTSTSNGGLGLAGGCSCCLAFCLRYRGCHRHSGSIGVGFFVTNIGLILPPISSPWSSASCSAHSGRAPAGAGSPCRTCKRTTAQPLAPSSLAGSGRCGTFQATSADG